MRRVALNRGENPAAPPLPERTPHAQDACMHRLRIHCLLVACALIPIAGASAAEVTIYRCTDAQGRLTLRDTPCRKGERQRTREMRRPSDPAPRPAARLAPAAPPPAYSAPPRIVVVHAPRPLYECLTEDGGRYTSESTEGNLRWVPLAVLGYPMYPGSREYSGQRYGYGGRLDYGNGPVRGRIEFGGPGLLPPTSHHPPSYPPRLGGGIAYPAGTWIRDVCHALPPQEVCSRLSDRRYELDRRYNSALQGERARITTEQRGIDARLATDCGVY